MSNNLIRYPKVISEIKAILLNTFKLFTMFTRRKTIVEATEGHVINGNQSFVLLDAPNDDNVASYVHTLKTRDIKVVVRTYDSTLSPTKVIEDSNISFVDVPFEAGETPPDKAVTQWLLLLRNIFQAKNRFTNIGLQCVGGFERAYILIAIALMESSKDTGVVIHLVREVLKGNFTAKQINWLWNYDRKTKGFIPRCIGFLSSK